MQITLHWSNADLSPSPTVGPVTFELEKTTVAKTSIY